MKRLVSIVILAALLAALLATTALAAGPVVGRWAQTAAPRFAAPQTPGVTGACPMGGSGMGMMGAGRPDWAGQPDEVETLLGMTDAQLQAERLAGKSLAQIAAAKGIGEDKLIETILSAKKATVQQAVTAGTLTQAQADLMLKNMETMVKSMVERTTTGPMMGGQGVGRGMMGGSGMRGGMRGQGVPGTGMRGGFTF